MLKVYTYNINVLSFWIWGFYWWPAFFNTSVCVVMDLGCYSCPSRSSTSHTLSIAKPFTSIHRGLECNLCLWKIIFSSFQRKKISLKKKKISEKDYSLRLSWTWNFIVGHYLWKLLPIALTAASSSTMTICHVFIVLSGFLDCGLSRPILAHTALRVTHVTWLSWSCLSKVSTP